MKTIIIAGNNPGMMMTIPLYQVDAFASRVFAGNPAAVCPLPSWIDDALMQNIAMENNLAETAFFVQKEDRYEIRWFTPPWKWIFADTLRWLRRMCCSITSVRKVTRSNFTRIAAAS